LSNCFLPQIVEVRGVSMGVNYGTGKVKFPTEVAVGARVRATATLAAADDIEGGVQTTMLVTVEVETDNGVEPACTIEALSRWIT
jgi:acyl dehydratase